MSPLFKKIHFCALALLTFWVCAASAYCITVNIYVTIPRGGLGDPYANWVMARLLHEENPGWNINLFVPPKSEEAMSIFEPRFREIIAQGQIGGIGFYKYDEDLGGPYPKADFVMEFAYGEMWPNTNLLGTAPVYIRTSELEHEPNRSAPHIHAFEEYQRVHYRLNVSTMEHGSVPGFYIRSQRPPRVPRRQVLDEISRLLKITEIPAEDLMTFAYSSQGENFKMNPSNILHLEVLREMALFPAYRHHRIHVFTNQDIPLLTKLRMPRNIKIHRYKRLPAALIDGLMQHADLPVLASGDGSISQAIDNEALFFYELMGWKNKIPSRVIRHIFSGMDPRYLEVLHEVWRLPVNEESKSPWRERSAQEIKANTPPRRFDIDKYFASRTRWNITKEKAQKLYETNVDRLRYPFHIKRWARTLAEPGFLIQFRAAIAKNRATVSLPRNISNYLEFIHRSEAYQKLSAGERITAENSRSYQQAFAALRDEMHEKFWEDVSTRPENKNCDESQMAASLSAQLQAMK